MARLHQVQMHATGRVRATADHVHFDDMVHFSVGDARYISLPLPRVPPLSHPTGASASSLVTVFRYDEIQHFSLDLMRSQVNAWLDIDDVFQRSFLAGIVIVTAEDVNDDILTTLRTDSFPEDWGTAWWTLMISQSHTELVSGPHVLTDGRLSRAFRVYDDINGAFMMATRPQITPGAFSNLRVGGDFYSSLGVAVSSRVSSSAAGLLSDKPLHGIRFAVKDIFDIEGLEVTAGDRAFYSVSKPAPATCHAVKRLLDAGAELIGTLRLASLIAREAPTESVDFHAPFNPRADGYQSAWSSSGGSGAAIAAYDWIDFTLATDTTGSSRRPAMANGCFQLRLTHGAVPLNNVVPSFPRFDSAAMYTRDITSLEKWVGVWLDQKPATYDDLPTSIIYVTEFLPIQNDDQMQLIDEFIKDMELTFGTTTSKVSITDMWKANPPKEAEGQSVQDYLKDVGVNTFVYDVYHTMDQFREEYKKRFDRFPYINPVTRFRWDLVKKTSLAEHEDAMRRLEVYRAWALDVLLQTTKQNALLVLPITSQEVDYREDPPSPPTAPSAFDGIWLAPVLQAPEISVPIGELKYHSRISKKDEHLPVVVSILGKPGSDMALIDAAKKVLQKSGRPLHVKTGSRMFSQSAGGHSV